MNASQSRDIFFWVTRMSLIRLTAGIERNPNFSGRRTNRFIFSECYCYWFANSLLLVRIENIGDIERWTREWKRERIAKENEKESEREKDGIDTWSIRLGHGWTMETGRTRRWGKESNKIGDSLLSGEPSLRSASRDFIPGESLGGVIHVSKKKTEKKTVPSLEKRVESREEERTREKV